jgi:hypothetical protein
VKGEFSNLGEELGRIHMIIEGENVTNPSTICYLCELVFLEIRCTLFVCVSKY